MSMLVAFITGAALGAIYFAALWFAVLQTMRSRRQWVLTVSRFLRFAALACALVIFGLRSSTTVAALLVGFLGARSSFIWFVGRVANAV